jgi:molybdate transport system ATP-binding protein
VDPAHGLARIRLSQGEIVVPNARVEVGHDVRLHLPERDVMVATRRPEGISALNILEGTIAAIEPEAEGMTRLRIACGTDVITARITALSVERLGLRLGMPIFAIIKTVALQR